jgi:hypothetical protein
LLLYRRLGLYHCTPETFIRIQLLLHRGSEQKILFLSSTFVNLLPTPFRQPSLTFYLRLNTQVPIFKPHLYDQLFSSHDRLFVCSLSAAAPGVGVWGLALNWRWISIETGNWRASPALV